MPRGEGSTVNISNDMGSRGVGAMMLSVCNDGINQ